MTQAPILHLPDFTKPFVLQTDASDLGMGAVLHQNNHPIAFLSKKFCPKLLHASTYVRELHAITTAVKKWRHYLLGRHFIIETDQKSLKELMNQVVQTPDQHYYLSKLLGYDYEINYKPRKENQAADALSRLHFPSDSTFLLLRVVSFDFLNQVKQEYANCDIINSLKKEFTSDPASHPNIKYINEIFYHKSRVLLSPASALKIVSLLNFIPSQRADMPKFPELTAD